MPVGILHLSDIHFSSVEPNPVAERTKEIAEAFLSRAHEVPLPIVVITGDIAFSGKGEEYEIAKRFLEELTNEIATRKQINRENVPVILVPGNHDCDFNSERLVRKNLIARPEELVQAVSQDTSTMQELTSIQKAYFDFASEMSPSRTGNQLFLDLAWSVDLSKFGNAITFLCYNTAWVSQRKEVQGKLVFPAEAVPPVDTTNELVVSMFHHPYNWLVASIGRKFRQSIEETCDLVLTGHEHDSEVYTRRSAEWYATQYVEGDVLQDRKSDHTGFNVVLIEVGDQRWQGTRFVWRQSEKLYAPDEDSPWNLLERSKRTRLNFNVTGEFAEQLDDPWPAPQFPAVYK